MSARRHLIHLVTRRVALVALVSAVPINAGFAASLTETLASAYDRNATLNAQRAATRAADEAIAQAKAGYRPSVFSDVSLGFSRTVDRRSVTSGGVGLGRQTTATDSVPFSFGVRINQALFSGFTVVNSVNQAEARVRASRAELRRIEQDTLLASAQAYADLVLAQQLVAFRQSNVRFLEEQVRSANARLEVGEGTRTDVSQSRAELAAGRAGIASVLADQDSARARLLQVAQIRVPTPKRPALPVGLLPASLNAAIRAGLRRHPAIRGSEHLVDAQAFAVKVAEGGLLPSLNAEVSATESYDWGPADSRTTDVRGTLRLSVPIYQGGRASSQVRQAKETLGQQRIALDQTRDQVRAEITSSWASLEAARANVRSGRAQVTAARLALSGVTEERNVGQRTQLDVLQSQAALLTAQETLAIAERNALASGYRLLAAIGTLSARSLRLRVALYDPREHYFATVDRWRGLRAVDGARLDPG